MKSDVLEFSKLNSVLAQALKREMSNLEKSLGSKFVRSISIEQDTEIVIQRHDYSSMEPNVNTYIEKHNCMEVQPTMYKEGYEWYRILAFDQSDILKLFQDLSKSADINVVSRRTLPDLTVGDTLTISTQSLFGELTEKQLRSLLSALSLGYYNSPRRITTSDISKKLNIPRTTFETHLRKAQGKVLRGLIPYLELSTNSPKAD